MVRLQGMLGSCFSYGTRGETGSFGNNSSVVVIYRDGGISEIIKITLLIVLVVSTTKRACRKSKKQDTKATGETVITISVTLVRRIFFIEIRQWKVLDHILFNCSFVGSVPLLLSELGVAGPTPPWALR